MSNLRNVEKLYEAYDNFLCNKLSIVKKTNRNMLKSIKHKWLLDRNIILASCGILGIIIEMSDMIHNTDLAGNVLWIPSFLFMYYIYDKLKNVKSDRRMEIMVVLYSALLAFSLIIGAALDNGSGLSSIKVCMKGSLLTFSLYPIIKLLTAWIDKSQKTGNRSEIQNKRIFIISYGVVLLFWGLAYLAMFPGIYGIDAPTWYNMWKPENRMISSQWSVVISGLFYYMVHIGEKIGNANIGFASYTMLQMLCILFVVWKIMKFMQKEVGNIAVIITALFFALVPTHVIIAVTSAQDGLFAACFAMCSIYMIEFCKDREFCSKKRNIGKLIFWLTLLCIVRNNGLYAILVMTILSLFTLREKRAKKYLYGSVIVVIAITLIYQGPIYRHWNVQKGTAVREMLSIPLQQMASVYNNVSLDKDTKREIEEYVPKENLKNYIPEISDAVKNYLDVEKVKEEPIQFAKIYCKVCMKSPKYALKGLLKQTYGLWYLNKSYPDIELWHPYINYKNTDARINWGSDALNITHRSLFPQYDKWLSYLFADGDDESGYGGNLQTNFQKVPVLATFCRLGIYFWIVIYIAMYGIYKKWKERNVAVYFNLGLTCTVFLSPLMCYRYYAPVVFAIPVLISLLFSKSSE